MQKYYSLGIYDYDREKICDLYDSQVELIGQAYNIVYTVESNGYHTLTFDLPRMIDSDELKDYGSAASLFGMAIFGYSRFSDHDIATLDSGSNFRWDYLKSDYLIRYTCDDTDVWFVANKPVKSKDNKQTIGRVSCSGIESLLKTRNIYMAFDDENGIGTMGYLLDQILHGTAWSYDEANSDTLFETDGETEKVRSLITNEKKGSLDLISMVCGLFCARPVFDTENMKVIIKDIANRKQVLEGEIGRNLNALSVNYDSSNLCTRVYIEGEYGDYGYVGIDDVKINANGEPDDSGTKWGLPFLVNFDYYREIGVFKASHEAALTTYLNSVRAKKAEISSEGSLLIECEDELNALVGQSKFAVYYKSNGYETPVYTYGFPANTTTVLNVGDAVVILKNNHTHTYEQWSGNPSTQLANAYGVVKFITRASGKIGASEVQIEAKERSIAQLDYKISSTTRQEKIDEYNEEKTKLQSEIQIIYNGSDEVESLYTMMETVMKSNGLLYELHQIESALATLSAERDEIEETFVSAIGNMLRDGCWSNQNYIPGQEKCLYADAVVMTREMSRPSVEYTFDYVRVTEEFDIPIEDIQINGIFKIYDNELQVNEDLYIKKVSFGVDNKALGNIEVGSQDIVLTGGSFSDLLGRMVQLADLIDQKNSIYDRAKAISQSGTIDIGSIIGDLDTSRTKISSTVGSWYTDWDGSLIFPDISGNSAIRIGGGGICGASERDENGDWVWRDILDGDGASGDEVNSGFINPDRLDPSTGSRINISENSVVCTINSIISTVNSNINTVNSNINTVNSNINTVNSNINTVNSNINTVNSNINTINSNINIINSNINTVNSNINTINSNINTINSNITTINSNINTINSSINTINSNINTINSNINIINSNINTVNSNINTVNSNINTVNSNINTVNSNINIVKSDITAINTSINMVNLSLNAVNANICTLNTSINTANFALNAINTSIFTINSNIQADAFALNAINTNICSINTVVTTINTIVYADNASISIINTHISAIDGTLIAHGAAINTINADYLTVNKLAEMNNVYVGGLVVGSGGIQANGSARLDIDTVACETLNSHSISIDGYPFDDCIVNATVNSTSGEVTLTYLSGDSISFDSAASVNIIVSGSWSGGTFTATAYKNGVSTSARRTTTLTDVSQSGDATKSSLGDRYLNVPVEVLNEDDVSVYTDNVFVNATPAYDAGKTAGIAEEKPSAAQMGSYVSGTTYTVAIDPTNTSLGKTWLNLDCSAPYNKGKNDVAVTAGITYNSSTHKYTAAAYKDGTSASTVAGGTQAYDAGITTGWGSAYATVGLNSTTETTLGYGKSVIVYAVAKSTSTAAGTTNVASRKIIAPADRTVTAGITYNSSAHTYTAAAYKDGTSASTTTGGTQAYNAGIATGWGSAYATVGLNSTTETTLGYGKSVTVYAVAKSTSTATGTTNVASRKIIAPADRTVTAGITYNANAHTYTAAAYKDGTSASTVTGGTQAYSAGVVDGKAAVTVSSIALNGAATFSGPADYYIPVKATLSTGASGTANVQLNAASAYYYGMSDYYKSGHWNSTVSYNGTSYFITRPNISNGGAESYVVNATTPYNNGASGVTCNGVTYSSKADNGAYYTVYVNVTLSNGATVQRNFTMYK